MKHFFDQSYRCLALAAFFLTSTHATWADDNGPPSSSQNSFGVNRRIESTNGTGGISGSFSEPSIPLGPAGDVLMGNTNGTEPDISLPNPYIGGGADGANGTVSTVVDAGMKYECRTQYVDASRPTGWAFFLQYAQKNADGTWDKHPRNGYLPDNKTEVRIPKGQLGLAILSYSVGSDGSANVGVYSQKGVSSTINYPNAFTVDANTASSMFVKSVTAITQSGSYQLTNAFMRGCNFNLLALDSVSVSKGQFVLNPISPGPNDPTPYWGYASPGTGYAPTDFDGTTDARGRHHTFIVDFSYPANTKRNADGSDPPDPQPPATNRYINETVDLSLRKAGARPRGRRAALGRRVAIGGGS